MRAARCIAGLHTVDELAARVATRGLGKKTLGRIERGERGVAEMELAQIARACDLPLEFFTADLRTALRTEPEATAPRLCSIEARLDDLERRLRERSSAPLPGAEPLL